MAMHRAVTNGMVYEIEDGERLKPKGADEVELLKCGCTGTHRVRVSLQILSGWD